MSWKFGRKLKESHIAALSSFGRLSSSHSKEKDLALRQKSNGQPNSTQNSSRKSTDNAETTKLPNSTLKPGLLVVQIFDGKDLESDAIALNDLENRDATTIQRYGKRRLPYMVLEFDKNEIVLECIPDLSSFHRPVWNFKAKFDVSRRSTLYCQVYLHSTHVNGKSNTDEFLGRAAIKPEFVEGETINSWIDLQGGVGGSVHIEISYQRTQQVPLTINAFDLLKVVGKGSFGKVMQVRKKDTQRIYALKTIRKAHIVSRSEVDHTLAERTVLAQVNNPFIVPLKFSFQSPEKLYLVLAFVNGGELFHHLQREGKFSVWRSKFYAAELLCALEHLHDFNVIYRDLKPENILLDYTGHIALCDFGLCKLNMAAKDKTNSIYHYLLTYQLTYD